MNNKGVVRGEGERRQAGRKRNKGRRRGKKEGEGGKVQRLVLAQVSVFAKVLCQGLPQWKEKCLHQRPDHFSGALEDAFSGLGTAGPGCHLAC